MMTEAEMWKMRYQVLLSAVISVCAGAVVVGKSMGGKECIDLIIVAVKAVEDGGNLDIEREAENTQGEGQEPAVVAGGV